MVSIRAGSSAGCKEGKLPTLGEAHRGARRPRLSASAFDQSAAVAGRVDDASPPARRPASTASTTSSRARSTRTVAIPILPKVATTSFEVQARRAAGRAQSAYRPGVLAAARQRRRARRRAARAVQLSARSDARRPHAERPGRARSARDEQHVHVRRHRRHRRARPSSLPAAACSCASQMQGDRGRFDLEGPVDSRQSQGERMRLPVELTREKDGGASAAIGGKTIALALDAVQRLGRARVQARRQARARDLQAAAARERHADAPVHLADQHASARAVLADLVPERLLRRRSPTS